ncbi:MAG: tRNA dihydrouridine synthase DusB [unclassified Hahellaceae]|nr:tRNA dihydrouridine synthase DusB [Hahellaceae bacterium]|tara:strand:- start:18015 stop:19133 length:1119 start_codon:yes stop_codon:yes gene_type:complete
MLIGQHRIDPPLVVAPMAGVTDRPFRKICREMGAGLAVSEMLGSNPAFRDTAKTHRRRNHDGESGPISVQIAGADPGYMADAARDNVAHGAQIIDINMGCPAKKVCNKAAGSALMRDEALVAAILEAVVAAVDVPVTLKIRTGWSPETRNALAIARIAESAGIQALTIHGRTRQDRFKGNAEYDTIAEVKQAIGIPVIANGDIDSVEKALAIKHYTGADALMIGRAAQGQPWLFGALAIALKATEQTADAASTRPDRTELGRLVYRHVDELHQFYGVANGVKIVRKHVGWYLDHCGIELESVKQFRSLFNTLQDSQSQLMHILAFFNEQPVSMPPVPCAGADTGATSTLLSKPSKNDQKTHNKPHNYKENAA